MRWARGSGSSVQDVLHLLEEYKRLAKVFTSEWGGRCVWWAGDGARWGGFVLGAHVCVCCGSPCALSPDYQCCLLCAAAAAMKGMKLPKNMKGDMGRGNMQVWGSGWGPGARNCTVLGAGPVQPLPPRPLLPPTICPSQQNIAQMSRMLPPHMLKMMGGPTAIQSLMKQMEGKF